MKRLRHILRLLPFFVLLACALPAAAQESAIVIYYTTDTHGHIISDKDTIGLDLIAGMAKDTPHALLVDAGDFLLGAPPASLTKGRDVVRLMKLSGYFAAAVGNHEFDYGLPELMRRKAEAEAQPDPMPLLSANARGSDGELLFTPWAETRLDGIRICFTGLTTQEASTSVTPRYIAGIAFDDAIATAKTLAKRQRDAGCQIIALLSHVGSRDTGFGSSRDLALLPEVDVVIDGHSHVLLDEKAGSAVLVSSGAHGKHLGRLEISYDKAAGKIASMRNTLLTRQDMAAQTPDKNVLAAIKGMVAEQEAFLSRKIGEVAADLEAIKSEMRTGESPLGNLFADALRSAYPSHMAIVNSGGLRAGLKKGPVSMGDIISIVPFRDQAVSVEVTGRELLEILEFGFSRLPGPSGAFPQISGMVVRLDPRLPAGKRIVSVTLENNKPLLPDERYVLVTSDYMAQGGDGYPVLPGKPLLRSDISMQEAAILFFEKQAGTACRPGPPGRIIMEGR